MEGRTCIGCASFEADAPRKEEASLVRCMNEANRQGLWFKLVKAGTAACQRFEAAAR